MKDSPLDMIWIIVVLALVFYLTWLVTRFVAARTKGRAAGRFMRVVDRLAISNDKTILLVRVGAEYCVIGVTGHEMRLIKTLTVEEADAFEEASQQDAGAQWVPQGASGVVLKGMQSFAERFGSAMKRPQYKPPKPEEPSEKKLDEQSVIDMMNERIKLRKDSKWR